MTQAQQILFWMEAGHSITALEALNQFGCMRLAARVDELRKQGHNVVATTEQKNGKSWSRYKLVKPGRLF